MPQYLDKNRKDWQPFRKLTVIVKCSFCGSDVETYQSRLKSKDNHFCDQNCYSSWQSENRVGENHHQYDRVAVNCEVCGEEKNVAESQFEISEIFFCSVECESEYKTESMVGENNPNWKQKVGVECDNCSTEFKVHEWRHGSRDQLFCSHDCYGEWVSETRVGENHPRWVDGGVVYYGESWSNARQKVRERDGNVCQLCNDDEDEIGQKPAVHHIEPVRSFEDPNEAHTMDNMVQVCQPCHMKLESESVDEQKKKLRTTGLAAF
jgi:5-methylcytosine-specific restriction endonuclease McrA